MFRSSLHPSLHLPRNKDLQTLLYNKESGMRCELLARVDKLEVEITQQPRAHLIDLEERQVAADADVTAATEL